MPRCRQFILGSCCLLALSFSSVVVAQSTPRDLQGPFSLQSLQRGDLLQLVVDGQLETVRLLGVSAFSVDSDRAASEFLASRQLWLELGNQQRDAAGNLLAYVYVRDPQGIWRYNGSHFSQLNLYLAQYGYAIADPGSADNRYDNMFAYATAIAQQRGWLPGSSAQASADAPSDAADSSASAATSTTADAGTSASADEDPATLRDLLSEQEQSSGNLLTVAGGRSAAQTRAENLLRASGTDLLTPRDCNSFSSRSEAQAFFERVAELTGERDFHNLDPQGDGQACN